MNFSVELTLEQEFNLTMYKEMIRGLSQDQAQGYLLEILRQMMIKDNLIKHLLISDIF